MTLRLFPEWYNPEIHQSQIVDFPNPILTSAIGMLNPSTWTIWDTLLGVGGFADREKSGLV